MPIPPANIEFNHLRGLRIGIKGKRPKLEARQIGFVNNTAEDLAGKEAHVRYDSRRRRVNSPSAISIENNGRTADDVPTDFTSLLESPEPVECPSFLPNSHVRSPPASFSAGPRSPPDFHNLANQAYFAISGLSLPPIPDLEPFVSPYQSPSYYRPPDPFWHRQDHHAEPPQQPTPDSLPNESERSLDSVEQPEVAEPQPSTPTADSPLASRLAYVLRAVTNAGFESLEDVVGALYTTEFSEETPDQKICRSHSDSGWEGRVETMIGAIQKHAPTKLAHKAQWPYQRAIFSAAAPLYKRRFDCLNNLRIEAKPTSDDLEQRKSRTILHVDVTTITPNFFARNILGDLTQIFKDKASSDLRGVFGASCYMIIHWHISVQILFHSAECSANSQS